MADVMSRGGRLDEVRQGGQAVLPDKPLQICLHSEEAHNSTPQEVREGFQGRDKARVWGTCVLECKQCKANVRPGITHPRQLSVTSAKQKHWQQQALDAVSWPLSARSSVSWTWGLEPQHGRVSRSPKEVRLLSRSHATAGFESHTDTIEEAWDPIWYGHRVQGLVLGQRPLGRSSLVFTSCHKDNTLLAKIGVWNGFWNVKENEKDNCFSLSPSHMLEQENTSAMPLLLLHISAERRLPFEYGRLCRFIQTGLLRKHMIAWM
eukprot:1142901-Pelagomonas_calceolata.AAC.1